MGSHYSCDPPEKRAKKRRYAIFCPKGQNCSAWRCIVSLRRAGDADKGDILFLEREYPPYTPKRKDEGPSPSTPHIGSFYLEELHALRSVGAVYMASP